MTRRRIRRLLPHGPQWVRRFVLAQVLGPPASMREPQPARNGPPEDRAPWRRDDS